MGADEAQRFLDAPVLARVTPPPRRGPGPDSRYAIADSARVRAIDFPLDPRVGRVLRGLDVRWRLIDDLLAYGEHPTLGFGARPASCLVASFPLGPRRGGGGSGAAQKPRDAGGEAKAARAKAEAALFRAVGATVAGDAESNLPPCGLCRVSVSAPDPDGDSVQLQAQIAHAQAIDVSAHPRRSRGRCMPSDRDRPRRAPRSRRRERGASGREGHRAQSAVQVNGGGA